MWLIWDSLGGNQWWLGSDREDQWTKSGCDLFNRMNSLGEDVLARWLCGGVHVGQDAKQSFVLFLPSGEGGVVETFPPDVFVCRVLIALAIEW